MARTNDNTRGSQDTGPKDSAKPAEPPRAADADSAPGGPATSAGSTEAATPATSTPDMAEAARGARDAFTSPVGPPSAEDAMAEIRRMKADLEKLLEENHRKGAALDSAKADQLMRQAQADDEAAKGSKDTVTIINQRGGTTTFHGLTAGGQPLKLELTPGANLVPVSTWQQMKGNRDVLAHLKAGMDPMRREGIRDVSASRTVDMDDAEALLVVRHTRSEERLALATRGEKRQHVLEAAQVQERKLVALRKRATGAEE